ncbi:E3 ubiquitin-protein ligase MSL2-like [Oppia nitens]|uniref:E3 ubiquitin-protein ligase MSL2-like n=1 Tax=Oppia nitens TaxID=1686743 RepID=UPI0023DC4CD7|nr:E3 ubiquitin-protein ligase MSL2-like [Oppia nitens]
MNALSLYVTTCRMIFQSSCEDMGAWADINRLVLYLRQALTCCVCGQLLTVPMSSTVSSCQHHVCKACVGGKMRLKPSCSWCKDHSKFVENTQLRILLQCYRNVCQFMMSADLHHKWGDLTSGSASGTNMSFAELLEEGSQLHDKYSFSEPPPLRGYSRSVAGNARVKATTNSGNTGPVNSNNTTNNKVVVNGISSDTVVKKDNNTLLQNNVNRNNGYENNDTSAKCPIVSTTSAATNDTTNHMTLGSHALLTNGSSLIRSANTTSAKAKAKRRGCRCGLATPNPGKLTCCGQRCPCYVDGKGCFECKCRGCRNPHKNNTNNSNTNNNINNNNNLISGNSVILTMKTSSHISQPPSVPITVNTAMSPTLSSNITEGLSPSLSTGSSLLPISSTLRTINIISSPGSSSDTLLPFPKLEEENIVSDIEIDS